MKKGFRSMWRAVAIVATVLGVSGAGSAQSTAPQIEEFLPQGSVSGLEAVHVRFSAPAAAFGDPNATAPVNITCNGPVPEGQGRWLDDRRWTYTFRQTVPAGVSCTALANPQFSDLGGRHLSSEVRYAFDTGAPTVVEFRPYQGMDIDEEQIFILRFNAPVDAAQVAAHSHCVVEGVGERIPAAAAASEEREALMEAAYMTVPEDLETVALLKCARTLPPEAQVQLEIGPGVRALTQAGQLPGSDQAYVLEYQVRPPFLAKLTCTRERAASPCLPIEPIHVTFTSPISRSLLEGVRLSAGDTAFRPDENSDDEWISYLSFPGPFPAGATLTLNLPDDLRDDAGRELANADRYPLEIPLADFPPLAKFASGSFGVIERFAYASPESDPEQPAAVPVTLRHIESDTELRMLERTAGKVANLRTINDVEVLRWVARLQRLDAGTWTAGQLEDILADRAPRDDYQVEIPRLDVRSISALGAVPDVRELELPGLSAEHEGTTEVIGIPLAEPGFHVLEIESPRLGASLLEDTGSMYVRTSVLLTNLAVHMKQGRDDLLVWVTTLADAQPVNAAEITVLDCSGRLMTRGLTDAQGLWHHREAIAAPDYCSDTGLSGLFVSARIPADHSQAYGAADYAFALSGWDRGIETWRFNVPTSTDEKPDLLAHTVFDRSLFRAGERVSMKHFLREESRAGLQVPSERRPDRIVIEHQGSSQRHELPLEWQDTSTGGLTALSEFEIPPSALLGSYSVRLTDAEHGWYGSTTFNVEEFRLPLLSGSLSVSGVERPDMVINPGTLQVNMQLGWLSGGPAQGQEVTLSGVAQSRHVRFDNYDDYRFTAPPFKLNTDSEEVSLDADHEAVDQPKVFLDGKEFVLDAQGTATVEITGLPAADHPQRLTLEAGFADPNGEILTLSSVVDVWPSAVQAGIKAEGWEHAQRDVSVSLLALGTDARPQQGVDMQLLAVERKTYTVRKRMVGGFYRYDTHTELGEPEVMCEGQTDASGSLACLVQFDREGAFELVAVARDQQARASQAYTSIWVSGSGELWFGGNDDDRIDLIPSKREWSAGEEAEFQVRMPFREALALVSVEREGVLWSRLVQLKGSDPVVRVPIDAAWGPNAYVSVLVLRGRLFPVSWRSFAEWRWRNPADWLQAYGRNPEDRLVTTRIDLAKPAFRFGLSEIKIDGRADRLGVEVVPERDVYSVREEVQANVKVTLPNGAPAAHATVALAVVDDALLELAPNESWQLYEAMHPRRSLGVRTATMQLEVVGRRHYGRKAVAAGGGGGTLPTRQLFDTLVSWQPLVQLDANGQAQASFMLNDSLSRYSIVALADYGAEYFGSASASIVTRQDLQVVSGLPTMVREGDQYEAAITVRNGTEEPRRLRVSGSYDYEARPVQLTEKHVDLAGGESTTVAWQLTAPTLSWPDETRELHWHFEAADDIGADRLSFTQRLLPAIPSTTVQAALVDVPAGQQLEVPVTAPAAALRDDRGMIYGGLMFDVSGSVAGGLESVRDWWEAYPYTCLEQTASQAVALADPLRWKKVVARIGTHLDDDGLLRYFPGAGAGSDVLTAYVLTLSDEAARQGIEVRIPVDMLERMLDGLEAFVDGRIKRDSFPVDTSMDARRIMALDALARHGRATSTMLSGFVQKPSDWPTPTVVDWLSVLVRMPAQKTTAPMLAQARNILAARLSSSGHAISFPDVPLNASPGLMATRTTSLAKLMLATAERAEWRDDLPRMARGLAEDQSAGVWAITTENVLAQLALKDFSARFEATPAEGAVHFRVIPDGAPLDLAVPEGREVSSGQLQWPSGEGSVQIRHDGEGRVWAALQAQARVPLVDAHDAGYRISRRVVPVKREHDHGWSRGDIYRVEIEIHARDGANWAVLNDPIPAGAVILGSGPGRDAGIALHHEASGEYYPPSFVERAADGYRAYFEYLPAGRVQIAYTVRLNAVGRFALPPTRVEALYRPDLYGSHPNAEGIVVGAGHASR